ncbi:hypothetical protein [Phenylobacterium sp.]|uniref:hypothetical protein n=1 Tax=Phenylobacterium sp. TaxID=1871053 RepID=UPI00374D378D
MSETKTPPGAGFDALDAYRRMFATAHDGDAAWWYLGTMFVEIPGYLPLPVIQAETVMIYRTTTLSNDAFRMDWWEIGYMRDLATGEVAQTWTNPITGKTVPSPQKFEEGPAHFLIQRDGAGLKLELTQPYARIESVSVEFSEADGRILLEQTERKVRGFPLPDGSMPSLDSGDVSPARTTLSILSSRADLAKPSAPSSGAYDFELRTPPAWTGLAGHGGRAITRGAMVKTEMHAPLNPIGWRRLKTIFPECFEGDEIRPRWAK